MIHSLIIAATASFGPIAVTNHAGCVVSGELESVTNGGFSVSGRFYPLSVLPLSEQRRVRSASGQDIRTARERQAVKRLMNEEKRIAARLAEGEITADRAAELRSDARESARVSAGSASARE